jgi:hypothetical protein
MTWRPNPWAFGAIVFCAAFWVLAGFASVKLAVVVADLGARDVRHAIEARLDHRLSHLMGVTRRWDDGAA